MLPGRTYTPLEYLRMAQRRAGLMAGGLLLGTYVALIVSSRIRDVFQSEMLIQVIPQRVPDSYVQSTVTLRTEDRLTSLSQQVLSRTALEGIIAEMKLYPELVTARPMQDVVETMRSNVSVQPIAAANRGTDAFYVRFAYPDRTLATRVTERLGGLFIDLNAKDRGDLAQSTDEFLEAQMAQTRKELEAQEQKLEQFRQRYAGRLPSQLDFNMQAIQNTQLSIQALVESLARDRDRKLLLERLFSDLRTERPASTAATGLAREIKDGDPAGAPGVPAELQLATAREALERLRLRLTPEHPDVVRAQRTIAELEQKVALEAKAVASAPGRPAPVVLSPDEVARRERARQMQAELDSLQRQIAFKEQQEQRLRETLASYQGRIEAIPGIESEWTSLTRDYDTKQAAYKSLLAKSEQSKVAMELERRQIGEQFRVLDPARPPARPRGIPRLQVNGIGALAGLALGVLLGAFLEFRDRTFHSAEDVVQVLGLPIIGRLPFVAIEEDLQRMRRSRLVASTAVVVAVVAGGMGFWALELWKYVV